MPVVSSGVRQGVRGKIEVEDYEIQITKYKIKKQQGYTVQHSKL